jgi:hypothetical protein
VKGFLSFNTLPFTNIPPDVAVQSCAGTRRLEILFGVVFTKFMVYLINKLATFSYAVGVFYYGILSLFLGIFEFFNPQNQNIFFVRPVTTGRGVGGVALERMTV